MTNNIYESKCLDVKIKLFWTDTHCTIVLQNAGILWCKLCSTRRTLPIKVYLGFFFFSWLLKYLQRTCEIDVHRKKTDSTQTSKSHNFEVPLIIQNQKNKNSLLTILINVNFMNVSSPKQYFTYFLLFCSKIKN